MFLDFSPEVVAFSSQPFWLTWRDERSRKHAPDFFARMADGTGLLIDVRPDDRIDENDAEVLALTRRACEAVGRSYQRIGALEPVLAANLGSPWERGRSRRALTRSRPCSPSTSPAARVADVMVFRSGRYAAVPDATTIHR